MTAAPGSAPSLPAQAGPATSAWHRVRGTMTRLERTRVGGTAALVLAPHAIGATAWAVAPLVWKAARIEEKWPAGPAGGAAEQVAPLRTCSRHGARPVHDLV
ncbi:hypothetical protein ACWDFL_31190 [Streptomyces bungoensis]